jgi:hypothetical protein
MNETPNKMNNTILQFYISITICFVSVVIGYSVYSINDRTLMSKNIENAITKGVDPLSVRCSYQTTTDSICIAYSLKGK